jgi:hypothetical protein
MTALQGKDAVEFSDIRRFRFSVFAINKWARYFVSALAVAMAAGEPVVLTVGLFGVFIRARMQVTGCEASAKEFDVAIGFDVCLA